MESARITPALEFFQTPTFQQTKLAKTLLAAFPSMLVSHFSEYNIGKEHFHKIINLSLCLLRPLFPFQTHYQTFSESREPSQFLSSKIRDQLKSFTALTDSHFLYETSSSNPMDVLAGILVIRFTTHDIMDFHQETPKVIEYWQTQLYKIFSTLLKSFPSNNYKILALIDSKIQRLPVDASNESINTFVVKTLANYHIDIHWCSEDEEEVIWMKRWIKATEKCRNSSRPSAFGTRVTHAAFSKLCSSARKNWLYQLVQIPGIEYETALAIQQRFPTPSALIDLLSNQNDINEALEEIRNTEVDYPSGRKKINSALVSRIFELFNPNASPLQWIVPNFT